MNSTHENEEEACLDNLTMIPFTKIDDAIQIILLETPSTSNQLTKF
jgi:hypothetical protein